MDCVRPDHMGVYGYERQTTPHIDQLAEEGTVFEKTYSSAVWTLESIASLYTGLYCTQHGVDIQHNTLSKDAITLANYLKGLGYATVAFTPGSWHGRNFGFDLGFEFFQETYRRFDWLNRWFPAETLPEKAWRHVGYRYDKGARAINRALAKWFKLRSLQKPFLAVVHYIEPHLPYRLPKDFRTKFAVEGVTKASLRNVNQDAYRFMAHEVSMGEEDIAALCAFYDASLSYLDHRIDELLIYLAAEGLRDNTLIILMADHGENLGEHGLMDHQYSVHDTLTHVPLIMHLPGMITANNRDSRLVQNIDLLPTICELAGGSAKDLPYLPGQNLLGDFAGHPYAISEYLSPVLKRFQFAHRQFNYSEYDRQLRAIRDDTYKLIWSSTGVNELYHIVDDPYEQNDLIHDHPEVADRLQQALNEWLATTERFDWQQETSQMDLITEQRLRDLGYL